MKSFYYIPLIMLFYLSFTQAKKTCITPSGQKGTCMSILKCPVLKGVATQKHISRKEIYYLRRSACGFQKSIPMVCCPEPGSCKPTTAPPDPWTGCCGRTAPTRNAAFSARIDEYPWMGLVEFRKRDEIDLKCSSFLISGRYALSAAQCFTTNTNITGTPVNIRLGEYDTSHDGPDCVIVALGRTICNTGAISIPIEKFIVHPNYVKRTRGHSRRDRYHDIALIRLADMVPYSDFMSPVCLPTSDITVDPPLPLRMKLAGWGARNKFAEKNYILNHMDMPYVDFDTCQSKISAHRTLGNGQLCAGGKGRDACSGDAGSPLIYVNSYATEAVGIVSIGVYRCGESDIPGIYTKIFAYDTWIRKNIED